MSEYCRSRDAALAELSQTEARLSSCDVHIEKLNATIAALQNQVLHLEVLVISVLETVSVVNFEHL